MTFLEAVAAFEGWNVSPHNRPTRNNNPGNISWGKFAQAHGATKLEEIPQNSKAIARYAYFPDAKTGFMAMKVLFQKNYIGLTVEQAMNKYSPPSENDTKAYIKFICSKVGCTPDTLVDTLL